MRAAALVLLASAIAAGARASKQEQPWQVIEVPFGAELHATYRVEPVEDGCELHRGARPCVPFDGGSCDAEELLNPPRTLQCNAVSGGLTCDCPSDGGVH